MRHIKVYSEHGKFAAWPANHGLWACENEILVGFKLGDFLPVQIIEGRARHFLDGSQPVPSVQARTNDGGETWSLEPFNSEPEEEGAGAHPRIDFDNPQLILKAETNNPQRGPSFYHVSRDFGKTWSGRFSLPGFARRGVMARTDYLPIGRHECLMFLTITKQDVFREGVTVCVHTDDGGVSWKLRSPIGPEIGATSGYRIMPATVRTAGRELCCVTRCKNGNTAWLEVWLSPDMGKSWHLQTNFAHQASAGNPASLTRLHDGRLVVVYGWRVEPFGIRARVSEDAGKTWLPEVILRDDGECWDLGYPRTSQRRDGQLVTAYYWTKPSEERSNIEATIWTP
jgi:hypothetical protein